MTRLSFDALHLQSQMHNGQEMTIADIATVVFGEEKEDGSKIATKVSTIRAKRAAANLVALKRAMPTYGPLGLISIKAKYVTQGTQLEALMNMAVRSAVIGRQQEEPELEEPETPVEVTIEISQPKEDNANHPRRSKRTVRPNGRKITSD